MSRAPERVSLAHGNGGRRMRALIEELLAPQLGPGLDTRCDAARLPGCLGEGWLMSTDGFTVEPLEFPGGDIGSLCVHGTVNDLAVAGAEPRFLTLAMLIEEGLEFALLERIVRSIARACRESGVAVLAGDTKVVRRGQGGGLYITTTGLGPPAPGPALGLGQVRPGDRLLVSGTLGDHGAAVLLAREAFGLSGTLASDAASVLPVTRLLRPLPGLRFMRDPTRGGLATVAHDIATAAGARVRLVEESLPLREAVAGVCDILGFDPLHLASEGRVVAVLAPEAADAALALLQGAGLGDARLLGVVEAGPVGVVLETRLGGERLLAELEDEPLPRIC